MHQTEQQTVSFDSVGLHAAFEHAGVSNCSAWTLTVTRHDTR